MSEQSMIRINTKLDASGFSAGADKIKRKIEDLKKGIERIGNASAVAEGMQKQTAEMEKSLSVQDKAIEKTKNKIAELKKKYAELSEAKAAKENSIVESVRNDKQNIFDASLEGNFAEKKALMQGKSKSEAQDIGDKAFDAYMQKIINKQKEADKGYQKMAISSKDIASQLGEQSKELIKQTAIRNNLQAQLDKQKETEREITAKAATPKKSFFSKMLGDHGDENKKGKEVNPKEKSKGGIPSGLNEGIKGASGGLKNMLGLMGKFALMTFGVMTVFRGIKQAISEAVGQSKELQAAIASIKMVAAVAVQPLADGLIRALSRAVSFIASIIKALTGVDIIAKAVAASSEKNAKSAGSAAGSAKKEADEKKRSLASFDEIEVLQKNDTGSGGGGGGVGGIGFSDMLKQIDLGERLQKTLGKIKGIWDTMGSKIKEAWAANDNGVRILGALSGMASDLWDWFDKILDTTQEWAQNLDLVPLFTAIANRVESLRPLFNDVLSIIGAIYEQAVLPFAKYVLEELWPAIENMFAAVNGALDALFQVIAPILQQIWDYLEPVRIFLAETIVSAIQTITDLINGFTNTIRTNTASIQQFLGDVGLFIVGVINEIFSMFQKFWDDYGEKIFEKIKEAIEKTKTTLSDLWTGTIKPTIKNIMDILKQLWDSSLKPLLEDILDFVGTVIDGALEIYNQAILPIVKWLTELLGPTFTVVFATIAGVVDSLLDTFRNLIRNAKELFNGLVDFIAGVFTGDWGRAWNGVKSIFSGIVGGLVSIFKAPINGIIGLINGFIGGINQIRIPDWVPGVGGRGINIPRIPYLAKGAVIPPNKQFVAMLGDQTHGNNLEAPEDLIRQIVREEAGGFNQEAIALLRIIASKNFSITKREAGAAAVEYINDETERTGNSPVLSF